MIDNKDFEFKQILFLFAAEGDKLSFRNDNILIMDRQGKVKHQSTCYRLFLLCVVGQYYNYQRTYSEGKKIRLFNMPVYNNNEALYFYRRRNGGEYASS